MTWDFGGGHTPLTTHSPVTSLVLLVEDWYQWVTDLDEGAGTAVERRPLQAGSSLSLLLLQRWIHELSRTARSCWFAGSFLLMLRPLLLWLSEEQTDRGERGGGFRVAEGETASRDRG